MLPKQQPIADRDSGTEVWALTELYKLVKFTVELPGLQDSVDPDGLTAPGPVFPQQIRQCNTKEASESAIMSSRLFTTNYISQWSYVPTGE